MLNFISTWFGGLQSVGWFAGIWFVQAGLIAAVGLALAAAARRCGAAAQSAVCRATLAAVLIVPVASVILTGMGFGGWSIPLSALDRQIAGTRWDSIEPFAIDSASGDRRTEGVEQASRSAANPAGGTARAGDMETAAVAGSGDAVRTAHGEMRMGPSISRGSAGTIAGIIGLAWLIGAAIGVLRLAWSWRALRALCHGSVGVDHSTTVVGDELSRAMGIACPEIRCSPFVTSPCAVGIWRPTILLDDSSATLDVADVLAHELAHVARRDGFWNLLSCVAKVCLFMQPLVWLLARRIESTAEEICDDMALRLGADRVRYAEQLCDLAALRLPMPAVAGVGMKSPRTMLARRVGRILDSSRPLSTGVGAGGARAIVSAGIVMTILGGLVGAGPAQSRAKNGSAAALSSTPAVDRNPTVAFLTAADEVVRDATAEKKIEATIRGRLYARGFTYKDDKLNGMALVSVDPNTGKWTRLVDNGGSLYVTPDGHTIVYTHENALWNGDSEKNASPGKVFGEEGRVVFSPDSRSMIVATWKRNAEDASKQDTTVWKMALDGTSPVTLPAFSGWDVHDWSADGKLLIVEKNRDMYVVPPDGKEPKQILKGWHRACIAPDSRRVVYTDGWKGTIRTIGVDGADDKLLYQAPDLTYVHLGRYDPDGKFLATVFMSEVLGEDGKTPVLYADSKITQPRIVLIDTAKGNERAVPLPRQDDWDFYPTGELDWR